MIVIHSNQIPEEYIKQLKTAIPGITYIPIFPKNTIYESINSHPDIFFFQLDNHTLIYSSSLKKTLIKNLRLNNIKIIPATKIPANTYPNTANLNAVRIGQYIFHNTLITDTMIRKEAKKLGLTFIHCNQGYTRCSSIPVKGSGLITCDVSIKNAAIKTDLKILFISQGYVTLPGEKYGFIGGACGILPDRRIVFLGDIEKHPDFKKIRDFLKLHSLGYISLAGLPLYDAGSLIFIDSP